jgi:hypothetical protein
MMPLRRWPDADPAVPMTDGPKRADPSRVRIEKRPGPDWVVEVLVGPGREVIPVTVFGAADEAEAVRDALSSFAPNHRSDELVVLGVERLRDDPS